MKYSLKLLLTELAILIASLFCVFIFRINYNVYLAILFFVSLALYFIFKPDIRKERFYTEIILVILVSIMFYFAFTYLLGFFWGVYYTTYSKTFLGICRNVFTTLIMVLAIENIRSVLIKNSVYQKTIIYITPVVCTLLEIPSLVNLELYTSTVDLFNVSLTLFLPCIVKNIVLTFILYKSDFRCTILYQLLFLLPNYFVPVFPNLGDFFYIVINVVFPVLVLMMVVNVTSKNATKIENSRELTYRKVLLRVSMTFMILFILVVLYLTSNMFRFSALAIGSPSMAKTINKGDMVIIDKSAKDIKVKDVIAFEEQGRVIVHRVISIDDLNDIRLYQTKGDANPTKDGWKVNDNTLVGKVVLRIRWLGWPTVKLSELLQK
ncbi:MAG: signal peptidase I [Bacilli bacterium]|nr:signal peptidase I [Bacilli bacterium]